MPTPDLDFSHYAQRVRIILIRDRESRASALIRELKISQPSFSRLIRTMGDQIIRLGSTKDARYLLRREVKRLGSQIPVFYVDRQSKTHHAGDLHPVHPRGFVWVAHGLELAKGIAYGDLPYFLQDLRPAGFLGRQLPRLYPELGLPDDILRWSTDESLEYLSRFGADSVGCFIIGENAHAFFGRMKRKNLADAIPKKQRPQIYAHLADEVLKTGTPGSSAGGEQPKFLAFRHEKASDALSVLVKFSPATRETVGTRIADLLVCEHLALSTLSKLMPVASTEVIEHQGRIFLEVHRFDRIGHWGRRGIISLSSLEHEFVGAGGTWTSVGSALLAEKRISAQDMKRIAQAELYGKLIANTDRHGGNLSFFFEDMKLGAVTPIYDMLPMLYTPQHGQVIPRTFDLPVPIPTERTLWHEVLPLAIRFWELASKDTRISKAFRMEIAKKNLTAVKSLIDEV